MKKHLIYLVCGLISLSATNNCYAQNSAQMAENDGVWESTKDIASDTWDGTKEVTGDVWDGTKKVTSDVWDGTKKVAKDVKAGVTGDDTPQPNNTAPQKTHPATSENSK